MSLWWIGITRIRLPELSGDEIRLISLYPAYHRLRGQSSFETPLGFYRALEKKDRFQYLKDGPDEIAGYAPLQPVSAGGAYIHGAGSLPGEGRELVDPGISEYLHTIGTFPVPICVVETFPVMLNSV